ncbi:hypothetical protein LQW54_005648 [Pestalotiopsis sp. IQ-011]
MSFISGSNSNSSSQYPAHIGTWTNWSRGPIMGATLTLKRQDADLLIALTAFFVAFVGALRGLKLLATALVACFCLAAFTVSGAFSSRISTGVSDEVLIQSERCGFYYSSNTDINGASYYSLSHPAQVLDQAANYAQQCYLNGSSGLDCNRWIQSRLEGAVDYAAPCPFGEGMCRTESSNIRMDTGYIDSHVHLGINAPANQRVRWRNVLHCAPLVTAGFTSQQTTPLRNFTRYHYGSHIAPTGPQDYIYSAADVLSQYEQQLSNDTIMGYSTYFVNTLQVTRLNSATYSVLSAFEPIDALTRTDADLILMFLSGNGVVNMHPIADDWYRTADTPSTIFGMTATGTSAVDVYLPQEPASPVGCADQYQFCTSDSCGPLASLREAVAGAALLFNTSYAELGEVFTQAGTATTPDAARFDYFASIFFGVSKSLCGILEQLGSAGLLAQRTVMAGQQGPLPANQWQLDMRYLWDISMTAVQAGPVEHAYGPTDEATLQRWMNFTGPDMDNVCNSQKIRSTAYGSFSLFGLYFILVAGVIIVLTSYLLEPVSTLLHKKRGYKQYSHLEWTSNSTLQLQRMAHEELGLGTWTKCTDIVPATKAGELLCCLDVTDPSQPRLRVAEQEEKFRDAPIPAETVVSEEPGSSSDETPYEAERDAAGSKNLCTLTSHHGKGWGRF